MSTGKDLVKEAFKNARDNGYNFKGMTLDEIVNDMMDYDANIAQMERGFVEGWVRECLEESEKIKRPIHQYSSADLKVLALRLETEGIMALINITCANGGLEDKTQAKSNIATMNEVVADALLFTAEHKDKIP